MGFIGGELQSIESGFFWDLLSGHALTQLDRSHCPHMPKNKRKTEKQQEKRNEKEISTDEEVTLRQPLDITEDHLNAADSPENVNSVCIEPSFFQVRPICK